VWHRRTELRKYRLFQPTNNNSTVRSEYSMIIDMHAHALGDRFLSDLCTRPIAGMSCEKDGEGGYRFRRPIDESPRSLDKNLHDLGRRLESLKRRKVKCQLFGPPPGQISWPGGVASTEWVHALHKQEAQIAADSAGLMEPIAVPCFEDPARTVDELRRAIDEYGFRAISLPSTAGGRPLDDPAFDPFFGHVEREGLVLIMHPVSATPPTRYRMYGIQVLVGWPTESTLAVTRMIFAGVFERHPELKLVVVHGGGNLVFLRGRLDAAYEATGWEADPYYRRNITQPPSAYLDCLFYDTCALSKESNQFVIDVMGADRVVFGSDYPFDIGDPEGRRSLPVIESLPEPSRNKVCHENAMALLTSRKS
jgi:aminocarboxymuconate-semialdehyde decarboxylase